MTTTSSSRSARPSPVFREEPKKSHPVLFRSKADIFAFIDAQRTECARVYTVTRLCHRYGVTRAGYYAWRQCPVSAHAEQDRELLERITQIFQAHEGRYGSPRVHRALALDGVHVSRRRVARLMPLAGLRAKAVRGYRAKAGVPRFYDRQPNRIRGIDASRPDQVWVGDITYLPVAGQWWYLVVVPGGGTWRWCSISTRAACSRGV